MIKNFRDFVIQNKLQYMRKKMKQECGQKLILFANANAFVHSSDAGSDTLQKHCDKLRNSRK